MARIIIPFLVSKPGANGSTRHYWQPSAFLADRGWQAQTLGIDQDAAIKTAQRLNAEVEAWKASGGGAPPATPSAARSARQQVQRIVQRGTVGALVRLYRARRLPELAPATRNTYGTALTIIDQWAGDAPLATITRKRVQTFYAGLTVATRDQPARLTRAASTMRVLKTLLQFACDNDLLIDNPATKARVTTPPPRDQVWPDHAIEAIVDTADAMGVPTIGTAVMFAAFIGQREADILKLQWNQWKNGRIRLRQNKTRVWVEVKALPELRDRLDRLAVTNAARAVPHTHILLRESDTTPYAATYFQREFLRVKLAAMDDCPELAALQFRDLRRTSVVRLAEAEVDLPGIAAISGHQIETCKRILETYLPRTTKMADAAIDKLADYRAKARGVLPMIKKDRQQ